MTKKINLIYGFKPKKEISAIQKYAFKLGEHLSKRHSVNLVSCKFSKSGLFQELIHYLAYPRIIKNKRRNAINHITSQEYAYLPALIKLDNLVITFHDIFPLTAEKHRAKINYRLRIRLGLWAARKARKILCDSEYTAKEIVKHGHLDPKKIKVIYLGYDRNLYKPTGYEDLFLRHKIPRNKKYLLYVGSETDRKNFLGLLKAFNLAHKKDPDIVLIKIGSSQDEINHKKALKYIASNNLKDAVIFPGFLAEEDLPKFYSLADVFLFPSLAEGFGFPVLEAMACGCPVICSDRGSLPEIGGKAVQYAEPLNSEDIADKILKLLNDPRMRKDLEKKGLEQAKKFSWERCAEEVERVYQEIAEK